jgi:tetratricopeptide (TPR) repeat protein
MGQFYKGAEATFIDDAMYKLPYELMGQVIDKKDKAVDETLTKYEDQLALLKADVLEQDSPEARKKLMEYQNQMDSAVQNIVKDPMNYQNYSSQLNTIKRNMTSDWSSQGVIGIMENNKKEYTKRMAQLDAWAEKNPNEAAYVEKKRKNILSEYQQGIQFNAETGKGLGKLDIDSELYKLDDNEDFLKDLKAQGIEWKRTTNGQDGYIYEKNGKTVTLTEDEIADRYIDYVRANPHITNALSDRQKIGVEGFTDVSVDNAKQAVVDAQGNPILKDGKVQYTLNPSNYIGAKAIAAGRFKQNDITTGNDIRTDSTYTWSIDRADAQAASMAALGASVESINLEGREWQEANTEFLNGVKDFSIKNNLPKDYNSAQPMTSLNNYAKAVAKRYGVNSVKYKEAMLDLQKIRDSQQRVSMKGFGILLQTHGVERTKQIMEVAKNLDKHPETVNLMTGTAQKFNPSTNKFEPIYEAKTGDKYQTKKGADGKMHYVYDSSGKKRLIPKISNQKVLSLLELKAHPEKYGLKASDFNVQVNMEPEYDDQGNEIKPGLGASAKTFTGTEKQGKHTPNYYVPNSLQPHYTRVGKDKAVGYYTYDLNINDHIFRMTKPMDEFELVTGTNIKQ